MNGSRIIIIGGGAAGLIAARQLVRKGMDVTILEARKRLGGRIHSFTNNSFTKITEGGAEFVHGKQEITLALLKEYKLKFKPAKGKVWHARDGETEKDKSIVTEHHRLLKKKLNELKRDIALKTFMDRYFKGSEYYSLRQSVYGFVEGYESADAKYFSTFAFREDWLEVEKWKQYRVESGYQSLIDAIVRECRDLGCKVRLSSVVKTIHWKTHQVEVRCTNGKSYTAEKAVISVPLGILQKNKLRFSPAMPVKQNAAKALGYGYVIKILLLFRTKFWEEESVRERLGKKMKNLFFLFSEGTIPVWWTQSPSPRPLMCGWLSGPEAKKHSAKSGRLIINEALLSLSFIFKLDVQAMHTKLQGWKVVNWSKDEFTLGSYSYATVGAKKYIRSLERPEKNTLFFAGEHLAEPTGTVEAAFVSGMKAADLILQS